MMITEEKIKKIKKKLRKGYPQGELVNELLAEGYSSEEINNMLYPRSGTRDNNNTTTNIPLWYAASIGFIILGIAILSVKYLWIYSYGYVFLVLGIIGVLLKYFILDSKKKK